MACLPLLADGPAAAILSARLPSPALDRRPRAAPVARGRAA
jgi:hypothetical protein